MERSIPERLAKVVAAYPSALAIGGASGRLSYAELARRSNALAAEIVLRTGDAGTPVAVLADDRAAMVTAMIATWKAGRICVPIDAALPPSRIETILRHSEAALLLTDRSGSDSGSPRSESAIGELTIDPTNGSEAAEPPATQLSPDAPACIIYTSGSTGEPKGLVRSHRNILHRFRCSLASLELGPPDRACPLHAPASGAGLRDVFAPLAGGAALLPFDLRRGGFGDLARWIGDEKITVLCAVVSTMRQLLASLDPDTRFPSLRLVRTGSEPLYRSDIDRLRRHVPADCVIVTGYGATEANGIVEYRIGPETELPSGRIAAGYPLEGVEIVLRDEEGCPVGPGEAGEVTVRSRYLSSGFWRQPELTRAAFEIDPASGRLLAYRTGDIGRLSADGCLELLGRRDQQVKVRGYRVHPGEIELALLEHPAVREAAVKSFIEADGNVRLVAYVVPQSSPAPTATLLRRHLEARLPAYMLPSSFVTIDALPLTANGKVDRKALTEPPPHEPGQARGFVAPRSPTEHHIAAIWERIFGVSPIGVDDDFFDLGGDSLLAASLVSAIEETCGRVMSPSALLQAPTVAELAEAIIDLEGGVGEPLTALRATGTRTPIFFLHNDSGRGLYTHALARCLDPDRPFFAVHRDGVETMAALPTVEAFAADRIRALRAARPHGPYVLGGHCHGGLIALEMARQLRADGEAVDLVVMIDTRAPTAQLRALRRAANALLRWHGRVLHEVKERFELVARVAREIGWRARYYRKRVGMLAGAGVSAQVDFARRKLVRDGEARTHGPGWRFHAEPPVPRNPRRAYRRAVSRYVAPRYGGRVALFRAEQLPAATPDLGWSRHLPRLQIVVVPGDHHSCITRHVAAFGASLDAVLRQADPARPGQDRDHVAGNPMAE